MYRRKYHRYNNTLEPNPEVRKPIGRPAFRWKCNIKMNFKETRFDDAYWIRLVQSSGR